MNETSLRRENEALKRRLDEANQTIRALVSGEIDSVAVEGAPSPTQLRAAQEQLAANEQLLRAVFEESRDGKLITDNDGILIEANLAAITMFQVAKHDLLGRRIGDFAAPEHSVVGVWEELMDTGQASGDFLLLRGDGARRVLEYRATSNVLPGRHISEFRDVTDQRETARTLQLAEESLRTSERRYRRIVEHTSEGVWMYDATGMTTFMNGRAATMLGVSLEESVHRSVFSFLDDADVPEAHRRLERRKRGSVERADMRLRRADGTNLWVTLHADPLYDAHGTFEGALALMADIGDRRRGDEARTLLASIVESSADAIITRDLDGIIRTWNRSAEKLTLYSPAEAIGNHISMLYAPEEHATLDKMRAIVDGGRMVDPFEMTFVRKDRSRVEVAVSSGMLSSESGEITGASIMARDISERKKTALALRGSEEQLRQAQKMEAIGSLAGGVAHDFNNLLTVILSYAEMLLGDLEPTDPASLDLTEILNAGRRAMGLTRQLLAFSRKQLLTPVVMDLNVVIAGVQNMLGRLLGEDIELAINCWPAPAHIHADTGQIEQVIMNLVVNARDAMPTGGTLTLETSLVHLDRAFADTHAGVSPGPYVLLVVTDTGIGMDRATQDRIFEPFFTTKDKSKGTGLGLSTAYGIVQQTGGHLWVQSELGKGTRFELYLPGTDRKSTSQEIPLPKADKAAGVETILLVEDDAQVRGLLRTILRRGGYRVLEAENAGEAFLLCEEETAQIHLLLTDIVMPRINGRQLAERLVAQRPDLRVLFISGYTEDMIVRHGIIEAAINFLAKPVTPEALLRKVRDVLDA